MNFKQWMTEWEGFNFSQEPDMVNGPAYRDKGIDSKYKGPGNKKPDPRDMVKNPNPEGERIRRGFGFQKGDFLIAVNKMMKKMTKR